ncbi:MAG: hypothetical protein RLZZ70_521 [Candidatus Parcubacteria bacterium]|jgi:hypothetical protein
MGDGNLIGSEQERGGLVLFAPKSQESIRILSNRLSDDSFHPKIFGVGKNYSNHILFMMTIQKISFVSLLAVLFFVVAFSIANLASAQVTGGGGTGCTDCGGGGTGGGTTGGDVTGGGTTGGSSSVPAPTCDILTNKEFVNPGEQYTISWSNGSTGTYKVGGVDVDRTGSLTYTWDANNIFLTFTVTGLNSAGASCSDRVTVYRQVEAPTCDISTNLAVANDGQSFTISWNGTPSHSTVFKVNNQTVAAVDSQTYNWPTGRTTPVTVTMTGTNAKGSCTDSVTVYPASNPPTPLPTCTLTANPTSIVNGGQSTLSWTAANATSISINQGIGAVTGTTRVVNPTATTEYTMTVTNASGSNTCKATVTVTPPTPLAPICNSFTATPGSINRGQSTVLAWDTTNVTSVTINNGVGTQAADGSISVSPLESLTYTLTANGTNGQSVQCTRPVTVVQPENPVAPRCEFFNVSDNVITRGETVTLSWDTTNATNVIINPTVGSVAVDGSTNVAPSDSTTYTLTATAANGQTVSCTRPVTVETSTNGGGGGGGGSSSPKCTLKISDSKISRGDRITLKWDTSRATEITLKDSSGKTLVTTEDKNSSDKKDLYDGEITLRPEKDTTYTLLAERGSKDRTCKVSVDVSGGVTVTEVRDQKPVVTGISLTQVPYTGFEAGPFLTMMFYGLLLLWALYLAYVLVVRRNGMSNVALAQTSPFMPTIVHDAKVSQTNSAVEAINTPRFVAPVAASTAVASPVIGYATAIATDSAYESIANTIEAAAHSERVLFSGEAMRRLVESTTEDNRATTVVAILAKAKASYPSEDGWVVINIDRMQNLIAMIA